MNMEQKINCNCSKKSGSLWWCWCPSFPILREGGREGGSISNPFISFQQSQLFAECNRTQFSAQQKYFSAKYSGDLAQILGLDYTCGPSAKFRLLSNESGSSSQGLKIMHEHHLKENIFDVRSSTKDSDCLSCWEHAFYNTIECCVFVNLNPPWTWRIW